MMRGKGHLGRVKDPKRGLLFRHGVPKIDYQKLRQQAAEAAAPTGAPLSNRTWPLSIGAFNLLTLQKHVGQAPGAATATTPAATQFDNSWMFGASYANNFQHSFGRVMCGDAPMLLKWTTEQLAVAPSGTGDTRLRVLGSISGGSGKGDLGTGYVKTLACAASVCPLARPFYLLISGFFGQERVKVTGMSECAPATGSCVSASVNRGQPVPSNSTASCAASNGTFTAGEGETVTCKTLTIERDATKAVDFTAAPPLDLNVMNHLEQEPFPLLPPPGWTCSPRKYWANDKCDCECGAYDPDCLQFGMEVTGCNTELSEKCSLHGKCGFHDFLSMNEKLESFNDGGGGSWITEAVNRRVDITGARNAALCNATTIGNGNCDIFTTPASLLSTCGYDGGDCLSPKFLNNFGLVFLSRECGTLAVPGESDMAGFVGSASDFAAAQSTGSCPVCPGDTLFGGRPTRNVNGVYVCDNAPGGTVDTANDFLTGQACLNKTGRVCLTNEVGLEVFSRIDAPFPSPNLCTGSGLVSANCSAVSALSDATACRAITGCKYTKGSYQASLSTSHANEELVHVQAATPLVRGRQTLLLSKSKVAVECDDMVKCSGAGIAVGTLMYKPLKKKHMSRGQLLSGILPDSMTVLVALSSSGCIYATSTCFDATGPYTVYIRGTSLTVASASTNTRAKIPHQVLTLAKPPPRKIGGVMKLLEQMPRESQTLFAVGLDYRYSWKLLDLPEPFVAVIHAPNSAPMTTKIEKVWPSSWKCPADYFNDGLYCDCGCGMFDPDCGRVRNTADDSYTGNPDGYWYTNPSLKKCRESDRDITVSDANKETGEMKCSVASIRNGPTDKLDPWTDAMDPFGAPTDKFAYVTWDNIDLNRNGVFDAASCLDSTGNADSACSSATSTSQDLNRGTCQNAVAASDGNPCVWTEPDFRSGDCVPSGTQITPGSNHIQGTGPAVRFNPYKRDHDGDGIPDVAVTSSPPKVPVDGRPPLKTPPYHPATSARYRVPPVCQPTAAGNATITCLDSSGNTDATCTANIANEALCHAATAADFSNCIYSGPGCGNFNDMVTCAAQKTNSGAQACQVFRAAPTGSNAQLIYGTEYLDYELVGDLPALTKFRKAHPQGADMFPMYSNCGEPFCYGGPACLAIVRNALTTSTACTGQNTTNGSPCTYTQTMGCTPDDSNPANCDCQLLDPSSRTPGISELRTASWEAGTIALFMDGLEMSKGYYLEDTVPLGTTVSTAKMTRLRYFEEHPQQLVRNIPDEVRIANVDPEDIPLSLFGLQRDYDSHVVSRFFEVQMLREEGPYRPEDRHRPTRSEPTKSPDALDVDLSVFIVPDRMSFSSGALKYCPQLVIQNRTTPYMFADPQPGDMTGWKIRSGRELNVTSCRTIHLTNATDGCVSSDQLKSAYPGQYRGKCSADMPPTHVFSFATEMYANNKWLYDGKSWSGYSRPDDGKYPAEYHLQISHIYHFSHALIDDDAENQMAEGMPASKDATQTGASKLYTGAEAYRGRGRRGSPSAEAAFPATAPFLESTMTFFLAPEALDDVMDCKSQYWVPERDWVKERLDTFPTFNVTWDYSLVGGSAGQLLLEPGYLYAPLIIA
jgi:hypothetical protein